MVPSPNVNDRSSLPPRLAFYGNEWAMMELPRRPHQPDWAFEQTLDRMVEAGFHGVQASSKHKREIQARSLAYATSGRVNSPAEVEPHFKSAADDGASCTTLHVGWGMEADGEMDGLVDSVLECGTKYRVPAYIETHRATITQDLWRLTQLIRRRPAIRFNGDFSHLYCSGELVYPGFDKVRHYFEPILDRVCFIHGRISNGESMQIDVGDGHANPHAINFQWLWRESFRRWMGRAAPGDIFIFAPELGPPSSGYSITYQNPSGQPVEISDRWEQTLMLKQLAEECWSQL